MKEIRKLFLSPVLAVMFLGGIPAANGAEYLSSAERLNGSKTLEAFRSVFGPVSDSLVTIGYVTKGEAPIAVGVAVSDDGLILTKASEFMKSSRIRVYTSDGKGHRPTVLDTDAKHDLILLRIPVRGLKPVLWGASDSVSLGHWIASVSGGKDGIRLGAVSANRRAIERSGGAIGVMLGEESADGGVKIESVAPRGSANDAGLKAGDIIRLLDGNKVEGRTALIDAVKGRNPGELIKIQVEREGAKMDFDVVLRSRSALSNNWERDPMMGGKASRRVDDFPEVIQHDTPLDASSMGGILLDLEGRVVGMNIARIDRVTTFALPAEIVRKVVEKLVAAAPKLIDAPEAVQVERRAKGRSGHYRN